MKTEFYHYADSGHGWLEVPRDLLHDLGIADDISHFSYQRLDKVFLEEDSDFMKFARAMRAAGREFKTAEIYTDGESFVRSLAPYCAEVQS